MRVDLQGTQGGYFIDCESALGVMTGWRTLLNTKRQGFLPECEGFSLNSVYGSRTEDFLRIFVPRGQEFLRVQLRKSSRIRSKNSKVRIHKQKRIIAIQMQKLKFHYLLPKIQTSLVQTNQKACLAQTGDG
jgi:hypothetical protein